MPILKWPAQRAALPPVAVIGCGAAARQFCLPVLRKYPGFRRSVILVDRDLAQAEAVAREFGILHCGTDYRSLPMGVHAAIIMTPHNLHAEQSNHFLQRGQHVFVEKPLGMTESEVEGMLTAGASSGAALMVNNYRRLFPAYRRVREILRSGQLGEILRVTIHDGDKFAWNSVSSFYLRDPKARGVFLDRGAHTVDVLCWWLGAVPSVIDARCDALGGVEALMDVQLACLEAAIDLKFSRLYRLANCYTIECEKARICGGLFDTSRFRIVREGKTELVTDPPTLYYECAWQLMENFVRVIQGRESPLFIAQDVAPSISVIEQAYRRAVPYEEPWYGLDPNLSVLAEQGARTSHREQPHQHTGGDLS